MSLDTVIRAGVPSLDDCPILTRMQAFIVDQGTTVTLEHVFRDRNGNPVDLSPLFGAGGDSLSDADWLGRVRLRVKEETAKGANDSTNPIWEVPAYPHEPGTGTVRADLDPVINDRSGVYRLSWAVEQTGRGLVLVNNAFLSVEKSLFAEDITTVQNDLGPITLQELRGLLRDSSAVENVRLDDVEWTDEQMVLAIVRPIRHWNEVPPPIATYTTRNFPWRKHWEDGVIASMYRMAAHWYRRNKQQIQGAGLVDDDLNRDEVYQAIADRMWSAYTEWVTIKKLELNMRQVVGAIGSPYGGPYGAHY